MAPVVRPVCLVFQTKELFIGNICVEVLAIEDVQSDEAIQVISKQKELGQKVSLRGQEERSSCSLIYLYLFS